MAPLDLFEATIAMIPRTRPAIGYQQTQMELIPQTRLATAPGAFGFGIAFLSTPAISLAGIDPNTVTLTFDSSWRPDAPQTATVTVSYDGAAAVEVLRFESSGANIHPDNTNEKVVLPMNNPAGASEMVITFGLFNAENDWWWAIDNILVTTDAVPTCPRTLTGSADTDAGTVTLEWIAAANLPGASIEVLRGETVIGQLPLDANSYVDTPPGTGEPGTVIFDYSVRVIGGDNNCAPLDTTVLYKLGDPVMLAVWLIDEGQGQVINNNLGAEHRGQLFNGPGAPAGAGQNPSWIDADFLGIGVDFTGVDYFDIGDAAATADLRPQFAVSVASWVNPLDFVEWAGIFNMAFDSGAEEAGYYLGTRVGDFHFAVTPASLSSLFYLRAPGVVGEWQYVVGVYDGTAIRLYINGVEANSIPASGPILYQSPGGLAPLGGSIGSFIDDNEDLRFLGGIAYVALWDGALPPDEIQRLYQAGLVGDFGGAPFDITAIQFDDELGEVILTWNSRNGKTYAVDFSTDMTEGSWQELEDSIQSEGDSTRFTDEPPAGVAAAFYRVRETN